MSIQVQSNNAEADKAVNEPKAQAAATTAAPATETPAPAETPAETEVASGTTESEEVVETEGEVETETGAKKDDAVEQPNKKKNGFQKRVDKLNARIAEKDREANYWKQEALKSQSAPKTETPVESKPALLDAAGKPKADDFKTHAEYVESLTDWKIEQKEKAREQKESKSKFESDQQKQVREYNEREQAFVAKTEDFQDVVDEAKSYGVALSNVVRSVLISSDKGPELLYALAKDKELYTKVNSLPALEAAREIGKLENRISRPASETKETKTSKAPPPITPVGGAGGATIPKSLDEAAKSSYSDYKRMREEGLKKTRRRA
jgi:hypothetical protein